MRIPRTHILTPDQRPDPLIWRDPAPTPTLAPTPAPPTNLTRTLSLVFRDAPPSARVRTWGHREHDGRRLYRIAVRGGLAMHIDPGFGLYQHQLVVRNDGWAIVGIGRELPGEPLRPGDAYLLDSYSPHALVRDVRAGDGLYFVAVGMSGDAMGADEARRVLEGFAGLRPTRQTDHCEEARSPGP